MTRLEPIAWIALVARWVEVARASRAIPTADARLLASIAPLIAIEANTAALAELAGVPEGERVHARDLAEISIRGAASELDRLWRGEEWPDELHRACEAAEQALRLAIYAGLEEFIVDGDAAYEVREWDLGLGDAPRGTLAAMAPGTIAMPGEPIAWWCGRPAPRGNDAAPILRRAAAGPVQIYRALDERGRFTGDRITGIEGDVVAGLPLLTPILLDGNAIGRFLEPRASWLAMQRAALGDRTRIPVERDTAPSPDAA